QIKRTRGFYWAHVSQKQLGACATAFPTPISAARIPATEPPMQTKHYPVTHTDAEWRKLLTPEQYDILRGHGTERPGSCALNHEKRPGAFFARVAGRNYSVRARN